MLLPPDGAEGGLCLANYSTYSHPKSISTYPTSGSNVSEMIGGEGFVAESYLYSYYARASMVFDMCRVDMIRLRNITNIRCLTENGVVVATTVVSL